MVRVRRVRDPFEARVLAARLGAAGLIVQLRGGGVDSVYPMGAVEVLVSEDDLEVARELLLADEVESAFDPTDPAPRPAAPGWRPWVIGLILVALVLATLARVLESAG